MNIRPLSYIVAIAEEQTISRAAKRLFISRPALNHFLIALENELGTPLFKRIQKKMIPTHAGTVYIDAARRMIDIQKQAYRLIADISEGAEGSLSMGVSREVGVGMLKEVFPAFNRKFPNFKLDLVEGTARQLEQAVQIGRIDLAVMGCRSTPSGLRHMSCIQNEIVIVLPPGHRLGELAAPPGEPYRPLDLRLLEKDPFVLICRDTNIRDLCDRHFAKAGVRPHIIMECSMSTVAYSMVRQGVGASILMEHQTSPVDGVHCFSLQPKEFWSQGITYRKGMRFTGVEEAFIAMVKDYFVNNTPFHMN